MDVTTNSYRREACRDAVLGGIVDVTTNPDCCGVVYCDAFLEGTVDVTTSLYHGEAFRDAVLGGTVGVTTGPYRGEAFRDAVLGGTMGVTTGPCRGEAFRDAVLGGTVGVTTGPCRGEAFRDAVLGGTVGVTTGPCLRVIDTVGETTSSYLAILRCDATMLVLEGDIMDETTDSLGCIMSLNSPCRWAIMHCVGSMPW